MPISMIPSYIFYSLASSLTPGPANLCSFSAAIRYGKKTALRQWSGLVTGYALLSLITGIITFLFGEAFKDYIWILSIVGFVYIMWLAIKMLNMKVSDKKAEDCNFKSGFFIQITNVKIMMNCLTVLATYVLPYGHSLWRYLAMAVILPAAGPIANLVWIFAGSMLKRTYENHQKAWNIAMSVSLMAVAVNILVNIIGMYF